MVEYHPLLEQLEGPPNAEQMSFDQLIASDQELAAQPVQESEDIRTTFAPVTGLHQDVRLYVTVLLKTFVETIDAGLVRDAPFEVRLVDGPIYQPDIVYVANSHFDQVHEAYIDGAPDLVMEVVSLDSTARDRGEKFVAYETYGVKEYWLIDPVRQLVDFYHLGPEGYYKEYRPDIAGRHRSRVLKGFTLEIDVLWQRVLPSTSAIVEKVQEMVAQR